VERRQRPGWGLAQVTLVAVAPRKNLIGFDVGQEHAPSDYVIKELREALETWAYTDAHLVTYVASGDSKRQPRINKGGLALFEERTDRRVTTEVFFCDVDNPGHAPWNDDLLAAAREQWESLEVLRTVGVYHTNNGRRFVQPLTEPIPVREVEPRLWTWLRSLQDAGLDVDLTCRDWTRHYRLPHVTRDGLRRRSPVVLLDRMRPVPPPQPDLSFEDGRPSAPSQKRGAPSRITKPAQWSPKPPEEWLERIQLIAAAVARVRSPWHPLFLALSGALLRRGVSPAELPAIVRGISLATGADTKTADREAGARSTVLRAAAGSPFTGFGELAREWPKVADAVHAAFAPREQTDPVPTLEQSQADLADALRHAPDGLSVIAAECGLGKTRAAITVAAERAQKTPKNADATSTRAPLHSKTAISVDKHSLAEQVAYDLACAGVKAKRLFGPLSLKDEHGKCVCIHVDTAKHLVAGGQSVQWEFCEGRKLDPCEKAKTCPARNGFEGPEDARVIIGPHALLSALNAEAGTTGLLVIDEPPEPLCTVSVTQGDLSVAISELQSFEGRYASCLRPVLKSLRALLESDRQIEDGTPPDAVARMMASAVSEEDMGYALRASGVTGDLVECARAAPVEEGRRFSPPLTFLATRGAKRSVDRAKALGTASSVLGLVYAALTSSAPVSVRLEGKDSYRKLLFTRALEPFAEAVRREGSVVVMDANAKIHLPILQKLVGYAPPFHTFRAADGAPIERTLLRTRSANRKRWLGYGGDGPAPGLVSALRALVAWANEDSEARDLGIITLKPVEEALQAALAREGSKAAQQVAPAVRSALKGILADLRPSVTLGHYGAVRGLNSMAHVDCLATLGDPWPNLGEVANEIAFLGLPEATDARVVERCQAELEQAHGRIRAVHRARPARALHIGSVRPSGTGWSSAGVIERELAMRTDPATISRGELKRLVDRLGGATRAAEKVGCHRVTLSRCLAGAHRPTETLIRRLREATSESTHGDP
jgi:hypothetical protein